MFHLARSRALRRLKAEFMNAARGQTGLVGLRPDGGRGPDGNELFFPDPGAPWLSRYYNE
jgi:hypothetical protein